MTAVVHVDVHKTVISVRSAVSGLDQEALPAFAEGEERIVEASTRRSGIMRMTLRSSGSLNSKRLPFKMRLAA